MEFYIEGSVNGETGTLSIIGRCGDEPIAAGTEFRAIFRPRARKYPDELDSPREVEECRDVQITVGFVEAYGKRVEFLPAHMTGVLRCPNASLDLVPGGWVLTDECVKSQV